MKCLITYERLKPDTINGHVIKVTHLFSSYDGGEINALENELEKSIGAGIKGEIEREDT